MYRGLRVKLFSTEPWWQEESNLHVFLLVSFCLNSVDIVRLSRNMCVVKKKIWCHLHASDAAGFPRRALRICTLSTHTPVSNIPYCTHSQYTRPAIWHRLHVHKTTRKAPTCPVVRKSRRSGPHHTTYLRAHHTQPYGQKQRHVDSLSIEFGVLEPGPLLDQQSSVFHGRWPVGALPDADFKKHTRTPTIAQTAPRQLGSPAM